MDDIFTKVILALLSLDTIRAIIAMTGWVKPEAKYAWIIYGRYERNLIVSGLKELGFKPKKGEEILKNLRKVSSAEEESYGVTKDNVVAHLIILIAKYIVYFNNPIQYGGRHSTTSSYYINTMEMAHNEKDKKIMVSIMAILYNASEKPEIVITPKGGNPLFSQAVATYFGASFIIAKSKDDKSRISSGFDDKNTDFLINFEGSWSVSEKTYHQKCIVVDCNTSGGTQLLDIVHESRELFKNIDRVKIDSINEVYVLFRADNRSCSNIDQKFEDNKCKIHRFFDLDEEIKEKIYQLRKNAGEGRELDLYYDEDKSKVEEIISLMREKNLLHYNVNGED